MLLRLSNLIDERQKDEPSHKEKNDGRD